MSLNNHYFSSGFFFHFTSACCEFSGLCQICFLTHKHMFLSPFLHFLLRKSHRGQDNRSKWKQVTFPCLTHSPWTHCLKIRSCRQSLILQSGPRLTYTTNISISIRNRGAFSLFTLSGAWADVSSVLAASSYTRKPHASRQMSADVCEYVKKKKEFDMPCESRRRHLPYKCSSKWSRNWLWVS